MIEQQYMQMAPVPMGPGMAMPGTTDSSIFEKRLEHDQVIYEIYKVLSGRQQVPKADGRGAEWKQVTKPLMNEDGISKMMSIFRTHLNPVHGLTNITEDHASAKLKMLWRALLIQVTLKQDEYEIDAHDKTLIMSVIINLVHAEFYRGVNGHESRNMRTVTQESLGYQEQKTSSGGLLGGMGWGKQSGGKFS